MGPPFLQISLRLLERNAAQEIFYFAVANGTFGGTPFLRPWTLRVVDLLLSHVPYEHVIIYGENERRYAARMFEYNAFYS